MMIASVLLLVFHSFSTAAVLAMDVGVYVDVSTRQPDALHSWLIADAAIGSAQTAQALRRVTVYAKLPAHLWAEPRTRTWKPLQRILSALYLAAAHKTWALDRPFIRIDGTPARMHSLDIYVHGRVQSWCSACAAMTRMP